MMGVFSEIGTFLLGLGTAAIGAIAVLVYCSGAEKIIQRAQLEIQKEKISLDESAYRRKHRFKIAKKATPLFKQLESVFQQIRAPVTSEREKKEFKETYEYLESKEGGLNPYSKLYYTVLAFHRIDRVKKSQKVLGGIFELQPAFTAIFGKEEVFSQLWEISNRIRQSAKTLDHYEHDKGDPDLSGVDEYRKHRKVVFWEWKPTESREAETASIEPHIRPDEIGEAVGKIAEELIECCRSTLQGKEESSYD